MKYILTTFFLLILTTYSYSSEKVYVILDKDLPQSSNLIKQHFENSKIVNLLRNNGQELFLGYNTGNKEFIDKYKIKWCPTIIKFEYYDGQWIEQERIIGGKTLEFLIEFLGEKKIPIPRTEKIERPTQQYPVPIQNVGGS